MPMTKSSGVNQRNRDVLMTERYRPLPPGAEVALAMWTLLAGPDPCYARSPRQDLYSDGSVQHR